MVAMYEMEEKISAGNMIVANKVEIIKEQLGTAAVQVSARQQATTGKASSKAGSKASTKSGTKAGIKASG